MQVLNNEDLVKISGGSISAAFVSALANVGVKIYNLGRTIGSAIRRLYERNICPIN